MVITFELRFNKKTSRKRCFFVVFKLVDSIFFRHISESVKRRERGNLPAGKYSGDRKVLRRKSLKKVPIFDEFIPLHYTYIMIWSRRIIILCVVATILLGSFVFLHSNLGRTVRIGQRVFTVQVANTEALKEKGLSGQKSLGVDGGMLFVLDTPGTYTFWMKDMLFPLDIIWFDQNKKVVHIEQNLPPSTYPQSFGGEVISQYVLEVSAGTVGLSGINIGDSFSF